jgi:hypothetical protein
MGKTHKNLEDLPKENSPQLPESLKNHIKF